MLYQIAYYPIFGYPFILHLGLIALILFLIAVSISTLFKRRVKNHFKIHRLIAAISIVFALVHGILGLLIYLL